MKDQKKMAEEPIVVSTVIQGSERTLKWKKYIQKIRKNNEKRIDQDYTSELIS